MKFYVTIKTKPRLEMVFIRHRKVAYDLSNYKITIPLEAMVSQREHSFYRNSEWMLSSTGA